MESKRMINSRALLLICLSLVLGMGACGDDDNSTEDPGFDRSTLLESLANGLIIPNFEALQSSINALSTATTAFNDNTTESNLTALRSAWQQVATDFQHCSAFGFGPGNLPLGSFATVLGVFPVNEQGVEANIVNPNFNLPASFDRDIRGVYAVEYLIYGNNLTDANLIAAFDQNRKDHLVLLVGELKTTVDGIVTAWNGTYQQEFIADDGTASGSSISLLYNEFVKDYENLKNFKIELPAGLTAGQPDSDPSIVEAFYSGISRDLIVQHFQSARNIWAGQSKSGQNLVGFQEYLQTVTGGTDLINTTLSAIATIDNAIAALPQGRLSDNVDAAELATLRDALQNNTANFKSSMSSLLGISITFNSGDGD